MTIASAEPQVVEERLPRGFRIRLRPEVSWHRPLLGDGMLLIGGSPMRLVRLQPRAARMLEDGGFTVKDAATESLARRLLDGNLADPVLVGAAGPVSAEEMTVVIPVRDRSEQLERCLHALTGLKIVVVDDASRSPNAVRAVAERHDARLVALSTNAGPAAARNAGLATVTTPYVAFVDSDVTVDAVTVRSLAGHFADPAVGLVGPLVSGAVRSTTPRWFERYDAAYGSLALGRRACSVRVGAAVGWLPGACLVARVDTMRSASVDGFDGQMRVGEDVDLVWRILAAGWRVRYEPSLVSRHDVRTTLGDWLGRKVLYGTGGAALAERHGDAVAPARLSPLVAAAGLGVLVSRPWSLIASLAASIWAGRSLHRSLPQMERGELVAARLTARGMWWALHSESALVLRHWWPGVLGASIVSRTARRVLVASLVVDAVVAATAERPLSGAGRVAPPAVWLGRRLDHLAYGAGLWLGAARARSVRCLAPSTQRAC